MASIVPKCGYGSIRNARIRKDISFPPDGKGGRNGTPWKRRRSTPAKDTGILIKVGACCPTSSLKFSVHHGAWMEHLVVFCSFEMVVSSFGTRMALPCPDTTAKKSDSCHPDMTSIIPRRHSATAPRFMIPLHYLG
jgi:hypothetical protein